MIPWQWVLETAVRDHDRTLDVFLLRHTARGINAEKVQLRLHEVPFIGHVATDRGLCVDSAKTRAISEMPPPTDVAAIQCLLGMEDFTKLLRDLTQKDSE